MMLQLSQAVMLLVIEEMQAGASQNDAAVVTDCDVVRDAREASWCETE